MQHSQRKKERKKGLKRKIQIIRTALLVLFAFHHLSNSAVFLPQFLLFFHSTGRTFLSFLVCPSVRPQEAAIAIATRQENSGCLSTVFSSCIENEDRNSNVFMPLYIGNFMISGTSEAKLKLTRMSLCSFIHVTPIRL